MGKVLMKTAKKKVSPLRIYENDAALVQAVVEGNLGAASVLYEQYVQHVQKIITRLLGVDQELPDLTSAVFHQVLKSIGNLKDPTRLKAWITQVAVYTVRNCIRSRKRKQWLQFRSDKSLQSLPYAYEMDIEALETVKAVRDAVDKMSTDERICFSLRYFETMEIKEIADACGVSLRTAKRKLAKSERQFKRIAKGFPALVDRLDDSPKWRGR